MTQPEIEPQPLGPFANTLPIRPMGQYIDIVDIIIMLRHQHRPP